MAINFLPAQALDKLELPEVRKHIQKFALGELGKRHIAQEGICTSQKEIQERYAPVDAMLKLLNLDEDLPFQPYEDVLPSLQKLKAEGYILDQNEVIDIYRQLICANELKSKLESIDEDFLNPLHSMLEEFQIPRQIIAACENLFTDTFEIDINASKELIRIQRSIERTRRKLDRAFDQILKEYSKKGYLSDTAETIRNGRRVLSVQSEYKRQIKGIIHDESTGGRVSYIEPEESLEINNDLFDLIQSKKREILRLLRELCGIIASYKSAIRVIQNCLIKFDVIRAKALFGKDLGAICPTVVSTEKLHIHGGKHPLLLLHFRNRDEEVVSFDLHLHNNNKILIVSGPNAGGKTILMKSVGLLQLMVQSGIPVPVDENSEFGTFSQFFVDIGDQQSIEDDLSTYSSHLKNMKSFLDHATDKSLILIDELGSGTDPRIGGAIAEAILHKLRQQGVHAVITTHYSNLKNYAHRQKGVVNAAMSFDQKDLRPTYELLIGKPGSSFAFELAQKSQLPAQVIANAKKNAGNALVNIDKMLSDIQRQRKSMQKRLNEVEKREKRIDQLRETYERMRKDLEAQRKKLKMMAKEYDISKGVAIDKAMKEMIEDIKASKDLEKAKKLAREEKEKQQERAADLSKMEEEDWKERQADRDKKIEVGDYVKIRKTGTIGQVERIEKGKAYIRTGNFQLEAKLKDLVPSRAPMDVNKQKSVRVHADPTKSKTMRSKLDIRGMPRAEANKILEKYFDQALMQGMHRLEIIHGKGSGVLKQLVREKANKLSAIESVEHPPDEAGGEGVSIVKI